MNIELRDFFIRLYNQDYEIIKDCCHQLNENELWRKTPEGVSLANLICHVCEMESFWIDVGLCCEEKNRDRQMEFDRDKDLNKNELIERIEKRNLKTLNQINDISDEKFNDCRSFHGDEFTGQGILLWHIHHLGLHRGHIQAHSRWLKVSTN
ncbi:MAG: hypothetical protein COA79_06330 [Planctomycetota bacterium]|nr:MAG: hypothetical protein COA79_06330 [Planctomycetota bacterium]